MGKAFVPQSEEFQPAGDALVFATLGLDIRKGRT